MTRLQRRAYLSLTSVVTSCYIYFHMVAERRQQLHRNNHHSRTSGEVKKRRKRHQERRQRHPHHIWGRNAVPTSVLYKTTTSVHLVKTSVRMETSWPLASTSTTSTSRMDSDGACYMLNLPQPRLPTPTVFDGTSPTFPEWARELGPTSTSASSSTSTSSTSPTTRRNLLQQTSW